MKVITIAEYAAMHKKNISTIRQKAQRGNFETARKIGRDWFIDPDEPYVDKRFKKKGE